MHEVSCYAGLNSPNMAGLAVTGYSLLVLIVVYVACAASAKVFPPNVAISDGTIPESDAAVLAPPESDQSFSFNFDEM